MAAFSNVLIILLMICFVVAVFYGMIQTLDTHLSWRREKSAKWWRWMLIGDMFDPSMSEELKAKVRREVLSFVVMGIIFAALIILTLLRHGLGL